MYCIRCGSLMRGGASFCGVCGAKAFQTSDSVLQNTSTKAPSTVPKKEVVEPKVVIVEEKKLEPIFSNGKVLLLTFVVFFLSLFTIVFTSVITRDVPIPDKLNGEVTYLDLSSLS